MRSGTGGQQKARQTGRVRGRAARSAEQGRLGPRDLLGKRLGGHQPAPRLSTGYSSPGALGVPNCRSRQRRRGLPSGIPIMLGAGWAPAARANGMVLRRGHPCLGCDNIAKRRWASRATGGARERTAHKMYRTRDEAKADVFDYIERFYNRASEHPSCAIPRGISGSVVPVRRSIGRLMS
jgi:hypothetical protein